MIEEISTESGNGTTPSEDCNVCYTDLFELDSEDCGQLCIMAECNHYCHKRCFELWMKNQNNIVPQQILKCWECWHEIDTRKIIFYPVLNSELKNIYFDKTPSTPLTVENKRCIFPPKWYNKFMNQHFTFMEMYNLVTQYSTY